MLNIYTDALELRRELAPLAMGFVAAVDETLFDRLNKVARTTNRLSRGR